MILSLIETQKIEKRPTKAQKFKTLSNNKNKLYELKTQHAKMPKELVEKEQVKVH